MSAATETCAVTLPDGTIAHFEVSGIPADDAEFADASFTTLTLTGVLSTLESLASAIGATIKKVKPRSASVEVGVELALKEGQLAAIFVRGQSKANMKITLEWGEG